MRQCRAALSPCGIFSLPIFGGLILRPKLSSGNTLSVMTMLWGSSHTYPLRPYQNCLLKEAPATLRCHLEEWCGREQGEILVLESSQCKGQRRRAKPFFSSLSSHCSRLGVSQRLSSFDKTPMTVAACKSKFGHLPFERGVKMAKNGVSSPTLIDI